jgi:hypothetical protein
MGCVEFLRQSLTSHLDCVPADLSFGWHFLLGLPGKELVPDIITFLLVLESEDIPCDYSPLECEDFKLLGPLHQVKAIALNHYV